MTIDRYPYPEHQYLLHGELKPCPFCGGKPYVESCDRTINIGCESCNYHRYFHGLVQSEFETDVVASPYDEWYDKDAYDTAQEQWNRRADIEHR